MVKKRSINFYEGRICIREPDGTLNIQDDKYIPEIKEKIVEYINSDSPKLEIRYIIFSTVKEYFGIYSVFMTPGRNSVVPYDDPLYQALEKFVQDNSKYQELIQATREFHEKVKENKAIYSKKISTYYDYRRILFDKKLK